MSDYHDIFNMIEKIIKEEKESEVDWEKESEENKDLADNIKRSGNSSKENNKENVDEKEEEEVNDDAVGEDEDEEDETPDESPSTINLSDALEYDKFVDSLNQFRAAHSFNSDDIREQLTDYFEKLDNDEKKVLHIFIKGLIQVTMMDVKGKVAYSPSDLRYKIKKTGSVESEKIKSKKRAQDAGKKSSADDVNMPLDADTPIKIGESVQDKSRIYQVIYANK